MAFAASAVAAGTDVNDAVDKPVETVSCEKCHNQEIEKSKIGVNTELCSSCHESAHNAREGESPSRYYGVDLHGRSIHSSHSGTNTQAGCIDCHAKPSCNRCHSSHAIKDRTISGNCQLCHGQLPDPKGHPEQFSTFRKSMHGWMVSCSTCHSNGKLHFKDLAVFEMNDSSQLCYICHSKQYTDDKHGAGTSRKCVDCHDPHGEKPKLFDIKLPENGELTSTIKDIILHNVVAVILIFLLCATVIAEYALTPKEGKIVLAKSLRVESEKSQAIAIKVTMEDLTSASNLYVMNRIGNILNRPGITLLGMVTSMKDIIIFVKGADEGLVEQIRAIDGVESAEYSDDYEV